ncbi:MAG: hypothetical protein IH876_09755 [Gemmatimonadetes bacterium]|nr:hypothetical protein [Gemmatimonadota bacterium]
MDRIGGEIIALRILLTQALVREANSQNNPFEYLVSLVESAEEALKNAKIVGDSPDHETSLRREAQASLELIKAGIEEDYKSATQ